MGWIACDFDATLVEWGPGTSNDGDVLRVGKPIPKMVAKIQAHLDAGEEVRIFTARVGPATDEECILAFKGRGKYPPYEGELGPNPQLDWLNYQTMIIDAACLEMFGRRLPITAVKDFYMWKLYDDRCEQIVPNTGDSLLELYGNAVQRVAELEKGLETLGEAIADPGLGIEGQSER